MCNFLDTRGHMIEFFFFFFFKKRFRFSVDQLMISLVIVEFVFKSRSSIISLILHLHL